jgi:hypothetical protein
MKSEAFNEIAEILGKTWPLGVFRLLFFLALLFFDAKEIQNCCGSCIPPHLHVRHPEWCSALMLYR